jgi:UPF0755 protein
VTRRSAIGVALAAVLVSGAIAAGVGMRMLTESAPRAADGSPETVEIRVADGESFAAVARRLEAEHLIVSSRRFRILARIRGADRSIRRGTYAFSRGADPRAILEDLVEGRVVTRRVTIPEGKRLVEIAEEIERSLGVPRIDFLREAADSARLARVGTLSETLEGYLFPETYFFEDGTSAGAVVDALLDRFESTWKDVASDVDSIPLGLDRRDVVTLASIVEAETSVPGERPRIAAVYLNRLAMGWKLQADPTVRFAIGKYEGDVLYRDLEADSPYNTYRYAGLPPGPICAPGRAALEASLRPLRGCQDLYFVAAAGGGHVFTRTLAEHERAKRQSKRERAARERGGRG